MDDRIEEKIDKIQGYLNLLSKIHSKGEDSSVVREAKENLIRKSVEAVIDIANRVIALNRFNRPDSYAEYFEVLEDNDVIPKELTDDLKEMARFRNLITHQYHKIELEDLDTIIEEDLGDIEKFIKSVERYSS